MAVHVRVCSANAPGGDRAKGGLFGESNWPPLPTRYYTELTGDVVRAANGGSQRIVVVAHPEVKEEPPLSFCLYFTAFTSAQSFRDPNSTG